jgi:hypothetical protein
MRLSCWERRYEALEELFRYCEEHGIDAEVNNKANNGDTALGMAVAFLNPRTVNLLLEKGAEVALMLGSGREGLTVLMKAFPQEIRMPSRMEDESTKACLISILDAVLQCEALVDAVETVEGKTEPAAKRRRV